MRPRLLLPLLLLGAALAAAARPERALLADVQAAIMRGEDATMNRYPWMVSLLNDGGRHMCGGALIHPQIVMTAAHCFVSGGKSDFWNPVARIGIYQLNDTDASGTDYETRYAAVTWVNRQYKLQGEVDFDIALLLLSEPSTKVTAGLPSFIPKPQLPLPATTPLSVMGWGDNGTIPTTYFAMNTLQEVTIQLQDYMTCQAYWPGRVSNWFVSNTQICAGNPPRYLEDACVGDSGGPLFLPGDSGTAASEDVVYGIVSYGKDCNTAAPKNKPGVYTSTAVMRPWIDNSIDCLVSGTCTATMVNDLVCVGFDGVQFVPKGVVKGQLLQILNTPLYGLRGTLAQGSSAYTVALGSVGFYWEEHIFITINQYGRMAVWLNRGSGFKEVMPKKNANVLVPLKDGYLRFYKPASCSKSCPSCGSSTSSNSWSKSAASTASKLSKEERAAKAAAEKRAAAKKRAAARAAALARKRKAAKAGRAGRRLHNDINQSQKGSGEDAWDPNTKGCHWRVEIRKPTIRVQIRQPYNSHQKNNQPWFDLAVTLDTYLVTYPTYGTLGFTWPALPV